MRFGPILLLAFAGACSTPTQPVIPPDGTYALAAGSLRAYPSWADSLWQQLPYEYDVAGDESCIFRVSAGSLNVTAETYSIELQQDVVSCDEALAPLTHESGRLALAFNADRTKPAAWFIAVPETIQGGWLNDGEYDNGSVYVGMSRPGGGVVTYLRFGRTH